MFVGFIFFVTTIINLILWNNSSSFCWYPLYHCHFLCWKCLSFVDHRLMKSLCFLNSFFFLVWEDF